jgi:hypothetical protein
VVAGALVVRIYCLWEPGTRVRTFGISFVGFSLLRVNFRKNFTEYSPSGEHFLRFSDLLWSESCGFGLKRSSRREVLDFLDFLGRESRQKLGFCGIYVNLTRSMLDLEFLSCFLSVLGTLGGLQSSSSKLSERTLAGILLGIISKKFELWFTSFPKNFLAFSA